MAILSRVCGLAPGRAASSVPRRGGGSGLSALSFTGVKVFSATKAREREELGETVTRWLRSNADVEVVDRVVTQSSDDEFHCLTIVLFFRSRA